MFGKLLGGSHKNAATPEGVRLYAVGDVHGCADELHALMELITADAKSAGAARVIFLGDYVDRGPDSKGVLEQLAALQKSRTDIVALKGNHEAIMLDFLAEPADMLHWLDWGGEETLESYGVDPSPAREPEELADDLRKAMPASHLKLLEGLALTHREGDYLFVHAGIRPGVALDDQQEEDLLWIRKRFHKATKDERPDFVVVHGHQPLKKPEDAGWRIGVDTGACWTGNLTAVVLDGTERRFLSTK